MTTRNKYQYRCVREDGSVASKVDASPRRMKAMALAISGDADVDIRVQKQALGSNRWENTRTLFRHGQQVLYGESRI